MASVNYAQKWNFLIQIDGVDVMKFRTCSEVSWDAQDVNYDQGGDPLTYKEPGKIEVPDVTLELGTGDVEYLYQLGLMTIDFVKGTGELVDDLKFGCDVVDLARDGSEIRRTTLTNAYVKGYSFGDWDGSSNEIQITKIVLRYDFPVPASVS